ncbi:MAG: sugar ABC transporter substrate-binding protein [Microbacteriaceae bacterium]|nr:MAG: sugar ABC transporter substrate-binding protein [Microbacteriaceae bacterium]
MAVAGGTIAVMALAGCSGAASGSSSTAAKAGPKIGLIMLQGDTYFQGIQSALEAAVKKDGGAVTAAVSNGDPATENQAAQNMIQAHVDAVLMQPAADQASVATMKAIKAAKIPLICYGNCVGPTAVEGLADGLIQSDNTALGTGTGEVAAKYAKDKLGGKVTLGILNCDVASACKLRKAGFLNEMKKAGVEVTIATDQEGYLVDKATPVAAAMLSAHPEINMIWASNDGGTAGATIAVQQAKSKIPVFGTDISTQIVQFLISPDDVLQASTGQDSAGTAEGAYAMAKKVIAGEKVSPFSVSLPGVVYDRANPATINKFLGK